jgi:hypothetical protein
MLARGLTEYSVKRIKDEKITIIPDIFTFQKEKVFLPSFSIRNMTLKGY